MTARIATLLAAFMLAVTPTVRAMCDVGCVTVPGRQPAHAAPPSHCGTSATVPVETPARDECGHEHGAFDSTVPPAKASAAGPALSPIVVIGHSAGVAGVVDLRPLTASPPPSPPTSRPLQLRI